MDNTITIMTLSAYFKAPRKLGGSEPYQIGNGIKIKEVYNKILDLMADKTTDFLENL